MLNKVVLIGRLTRDPEIRYTAANTPVASFTLAVNRNFKNKEGGYDADFINITAWRRLAELISNTLQKGSLIAVTGRIQTSSYEAKDGTRRYTTDVVADEIAFLEKKELLLPIAAANRQCMKNNPTILAFPLTGSVRSMMTTCHSN